MLLFDVRIEENKESSVGMVDVPLVTHESAKIKEFNLKEASNIIKEFWGDGSKVLDYVDAIQYYADTIDPSEHLKIVDYICRVSLKGSAKESLFVVTDKLTSITEITNHLIRRFKPKETLAGIQSQISNCKQHSRSVSSYVSELEQLGSKLIRIQVGEFGTAAKELIIKLADQSLLSAFKQGLRGDIRTAVLAANVHVFQTAVDIALTAEISLRDNNDGYVNTYAQRRRGGNQHYNNNSNRNQFYQPGQINNNNKNSNDQGTHNGGYRNDNRGRGAGQSRGRGQYHNVHVVEQRGQQPTEIAAGLNEQDNNVEFFREYVSLLR